MNTHIIEEKLRALSGIFANDKDLIAVFLVRPIDITVNPDKKHILCPVFNETIGFDDDLDILEKYKDIMTKEMSDDGMDVKIMNTQSLAFQYFVIKESKAIFFKSKEQVKTYEESVVNRYMKGVSRLEKKYDTELSDMKQEYIITTPEKKRMKAGRVFSYFVPLIFAVLIFLYFMSTLDRGDALNIPMLIAKVGGGGFLVVLAALRLMQYLSEELFVKKKRTKGISKYYKE